MNLKPVPEGRYCTLANGQRIHYLDHGNGPVVVFLHGSGGGACGYSNFKHNYPHLVDNGYRVIVPDLLGFGYSNKPTDINYPLSLFVQCLSQLLDALGIGKASIIGNSLGGAVALGFALAEGERCEKLVLMAPGGVENQLDYFSMPGMAMMKELFMSGQELTAERMKAFFIKAFVVNPDCVDDALVNERLALYQGQNPQVMKTLTVPNMTEQLGQISCPTLGFWGINEQMMPETGILKLAKGIPHMRMVLVPQCGHWVMIEHKDLFNRLTLDFLQHG